MVANEIDLDCGTDGVAVVQLKGPELGRLVHGITVRQFGTTELTGSEVLLAAS